MFKRSTKITSLIVAAASIATMVPAMAADVKKIDTQDGTLTEAIAFKDGKFYIDGDLEDKDEDAYYLVDGKYTSLDDKDIDSGDDVAIYGSKYVEVQEGDYYLDLETGKVTDDNIAEDDADDASTAVRKSIKKDDPDRYPTEKAANYNNPTSVLVPANPFSNPYFEIEYDGHKVYTDIKGNYVDADYKLGKIKVDGKTINNIEDIDGATITHDKTLTSDKDYVYRTAILHLTTTGTSVQLGNGAFTSNAQVQVIQKISKAQDSNDDVKDAKLPKTVQTYFVTDEDGVAADLDQYNEFSVVNGKLVGWKVTEGKVKAQAITLTQKKGYYYTDFSDGIDEDVEDVKVDVNGNLWILQKGYIKKFNLDDDMDKVYKVDGAMTNLRVYDKDNIVVWNEDDEVYSIIAGKAKAEEETTTTAQAGWVQDSANGAWSYVKADGTKAVGWFQSPASGVWYYMDATGIMKTNGWIQDGGYWYFLDVTGAMKTGWVYTGGAWYFLKNTAGNIGAMQTGWIQTGGKWYYCNASGAMLHNTTVGGYVLGADGAWIK